MSFGPETLKAKDYAVGSRTMCQSLKSRVQERAGWVLVVWGLAAVLIGVEESAWAGLYYTGEQYAPLPAQWSGFLDDWRMLRNLSQVPAGLSGAVWQQPAGAPRQRYQEHAERLEKLRSERGLTADEAADLGGLYLRLGEPRRALSVLRPAYQEHPRHFAIVANLGTAWQRCGNLEQAVVFLEQAVQLAPQQWQRYEQFHLRLVQQRLRRGGDRELQLDDFFGVRYEEADGSYPPIRSAPELRQRLPEDALAIVQQLLLWLPDDAALAWHFAELAVLYGELRVANQIFDLLVTAWNVHSPVVRAHRKAIRQVEAGLPSKPSGHTAHKPIAFRSRRALLPRRPDSEPLPPVLENGVNLVRWDWLSDTGMDEQFRPTFPQHLRRLDGKLVMLTGFMQPLTDELEHRAFMLLEYPVSCWYCEMPPPNGIVFVELANGKTASWQPGLIKIVGRLRLNDKDPEDFLFHIRQAQLSQPD